MGFANINETETQSNEKLKWVFEITTESRKPTTNQSIRSRKETEKIGPTYWNKKRTEKANVSPFDCCWFVKIGMLNVETLREYHTFECFR